MGRQRRWCAPHLNFCFHFRARTPRRYSAQLGTAKLTELEPYSRRTFRELQGGSLAVYHQQVVD